MKEVKEFFEQFKQGMLGGLYTAALAKVEKYDPKGKADVTLLPDSDLIGEVPVATLQSSDYFLRVPLKKGDVVVVLFASRSIDGVMHGDPDQDGDRTHDINDAIIVGGINLFADPLPTANPDDLVMGKKDGTSRVIIGKDGDVTVEASGKIYLGDGAGHPLPLGDSLKAWLDGHTHTAPADGGATSAPTSPSPAPSGKVFTK